MRAALVKAPGKVKIADVPPGRPGPGETLVRIALCGVCGSDSLEAKSWAKDWKRFGHEMVGAVAEAGPGVAGVKPGDRVAIALSAACGACAACVSANPRRCTNLAVAQQGGFAEYVTVSSEALLHRIPAELSDDLACLAEPLTVILDAFEAARLQAGHRLLVVGGGFLGALAMLAAKTAGVEVAGLLTRAPRAAAQAALAETGAPLFLWRTRWGRTLAPPADFQSRLAVRPQRLVVLHTAPARYIVAYAESLPFDSTVVNLGLATAEKDNRITLDAPTMMFRRLQVLSGFPVPCLFMGKALEMLARNAAAFSRLPAARLPLEKLPDVIRNSKRLDGKVLIEP